MTLAHQIEHLSIVEEFRQECSNIASWWLKYAFDDINGGIWGAVADDNRPDAQASKSIILHTRTLWFFSEWAKTTQQPQHCAAAKRCYDYLLEQFYDQQYGGMVWMLNHEGVWSDTKKQTYAQAFTVYALSAYFRCSKDPASLSLALHHYECIERHAKDTVCAGYREALARDWSSLVDVRLSEKEDNSPKTMNTHLHIVEAYTELHNCLVSERSERAAEVARSLADVLDIYCGKIFNPNSGHLKMFMDDAWQDRSTAVSFGHDIESSWLIHKAIKSLQHTPFARPQYLAVVVSLAEICLREGFDETVGMFDERDILSRQNAPSAWWVQVEAMVGFTNMWKLGDGDAFLIAALRIWRIVQEQYIDTRYGEWFWFAKRDHHRASMGYKIGPWKAPYHNGRALMQMMNLLSR